MKKILFSLLFCVVGFIGFGFCDNLYVGTYLSLDGNSPVSFLINSGDCFTFFNSSSCGRNFNFIDGDGNTLWSSDSSYNYSYNYYCTDVDGYIKTKYTSSCWGLVFSGNNFSSSDSQDCSEIDSNYCVENDLCPVPDNFSQLFINNLEHQSEPLINVNIPDYITWDYSIGSGSFDLFVGSGYDINYINSIIDINSYRPTSQDFTYMFVSGLTLIFPYIFLALLIIFIWKLIKRIFK